MKYSNIFTYMVQMKSYSKYIKSIFILDFQNSTKKFKSVLQIEHILRAGSKLINFSSQYDLFPPPQ